MATRRLAVQPTPPGASSANPEISINPKRRLAAGWFPSQNPKTVQNR